jgi:type I restriction enzyme M protein
VELRRKLLEDYELLAVVSLPAGVFKPYAGVKTGVLVVRKPVRSVKDTKPPPKVWFYEVRNDGYDPDKIVGGGRPETPEKRQWQSYKASGFTHPPGVEAGALLQPDSEALRCWWASLDTIASNDYNLAAGRYKPQIAERPPEEDPAELIREALAIEREITAGLEKLLKEIEA